MTHSLQSQLKAANFRIASLKMQIAAKDAVIRDLKERVSDLISRKLCCPKSNHANRERTC